MTFSAIRQSRYAKLINLCLVVTFVTSMVITPKVSFAQVIAAKEQGILGLPEPGTMVNLSSSYVPLMLTGLTVHPENPLLMDFIVSTGNSGLNAAEVKEQSNRLIKYFLACLTIPENHQWVNLSPYEKQRIVPEDLGQTVLGQDMLEQDYILKQLTASLIYPEKNLGKSFWDKVYSKASQMYGTTQIPVNTFNKVWILPQFAKVYTHNNTVIVVKSHLKVMLDEDYLALQKHDVSLPLTSRNDTHSIGANIVRQVVLPAIEQEVNTGKNFAQLRQIYNSMILAVWFKSNLKQALLTQVYADKSKVNGVNTDDPAIKQKIYDQYLQAYKKGVFNYIKEEVDQTSQQMVPRKYFSGGLKAVSPAMIQAVSAPEASAAMNSWTGNSFVVKGEAQNVAANPNAAMTSVEAGSRELMRPILLSLPEVRNPLFGGGFTSGFEQILAAKDRHPLDVIFKGSLSGKSLVIEDREMNGFKLVLPFAEVAPMNARDAVIVYESLIVKADSGKLGIWWAKQRNVIVPVRLNTLLPRMLKSNDLKFDGYQIEDAQGVSFLPKSETHRTIIYVSPGSSRTEAVNLEDVLKYISENPDYAQAASAATVAIGSSTEDVDELESNNKDRNAAMINPIQIARGVAYWEGKTEATKITRPFRASREEDVTDITTLSPSEALRLENIAVRSLLKGQGVIGMLVAGASSRMNVKDAPSEVRSMSNDNIQSKAGVPIGVIDGQPITYLDAFGINVHRLLQQIDQEAVNAGESNNQLDNNDVLLFSNDDYRAEQQKIIAAHHNYGLQAQQIRFFNQPLDPIYWGTAADVEKLKAKFKSEADYQAALAKARDVQAKLTAGQQEAVIVEGQRDPLGHGEFLHQLIVSGELLHMFDSGKKWFFIKNVDNYAAKFDRVWLRILGKFLDQKNDFQPEVSPRAPGQAGGSLIVMEDTGSQQLAEDPTLKATVGTDGKPKVNPTDSFWLNDAVAIGRPEYVASLYSKPGQSLQEFLAEYRHAVETKDTTALETIAERGRAKFPKLIDPKLAKNEPGATVKIETNMWQSTGIAPIDQKIDSVGVRGARNFNINAYPTMSPAERETELANLRFLATKQWTVAPELRAQTKAKLAALLGREVTDAEVDLTLESYEGNKRIADDLLRYILKADLVTKGILSANPAMTTSISIFVPKAVERQVAINYGPVAVYSYPSVVAKARDFKGLDEKIRPLWEALRKLANEYPDDVDVPADINELHFTLAARQTDIQGRPIKDNLQLLNKPFSQSELDAYVQEAQNSLSGIKAFSSQEGIRGVLKRTPAGVVSWVIDSHSPFVAWANGLRQGFVGGAWNVHDFEGKGFMLIGMNLLRVKNANLTEEKLREIDARVAQIVDVFSSPEGRFALTGQISLDGVEAGQGTYINWQTVNAKHIKLAPVSLAAPSPAMATEPTTALLVRVLREKGFDQGRKLLELKIVLSQAGNEEDYKALIDALQKGPSGRADALSTVTVIIGHNLVGHLKETSLAEQEWLSFFKNLEKSLGGNPAMAVKKIILPSGTLLVDGEGRIISTFGKRTLKQILDKLAYKMPVEAPYDSVQYWIDYMMPSPALFNFIKKQDLQQLDYRIGKEWINRVPQKGLKRSNLQLLVDLIASDPDNFFKYRFGHGTSLEGLKMFGFQGPDKEKSMLLREVLIRSGFLEHAQHRQDMDNLEVGMGLVDYMGRAGKVVRVFNEGEKEHVEYKIFRNNEVRSAKSEEFLYILPNSAMTVNNEEALFQAEEGAASEFINEEAQGSNRVAVLKAKSKGAEYLIATNKRVVRRKKDVDHAALANPGGIDLNSKNLNLQSSGDRVNITFDPVMIAQFKRGDFSGVRIQILDVVPINLMPLLGLKEEETTVAKA